MASSSIGESLAPLFNEAEMHSFERHLINRSHDVELHINQRLSLAIEASHFHKKRTDRLLLITEHDVMLGKEYEEEDILNQQESVLFEIYNNLGECCKDVAREHEAMAQAVSKAKTIEEAASTNMSSSFAAPFDSPPPESSKEMYPQIPNGVAYTNHPPESSLPQGVPEALMGTAPHAVSTGEQWLAVQSPTMISNLPNVPDPNQAWQGFNEHSGCFL